MKRFIGFLMAIIMTNITLYAQIEGSIQWEKDKNFTFQETDEYIEIVSESGYIDVAGAPGLPYLTKTFLVPVNAQVSLQIESVGKNLEKKDILLYPVQPPISVSGNSPDWVEPNSIIYNSLDPFPGKYAEIVSDREDFGYHLVTIRFYPMEYIPKKRELYTCDITYTLTYSAARTLDSSSGTEKQSEYLNQLDKDYIRSIIENKEMLGNVAPNIKRLIKKGNSVTANVASESNMTSVIETRFPEYLIITNEALRETFQVLANWKIKKGIPAIIETVENITATYQGSDIQEKIRNYLIDMKRKYGSLFVLLVPYLLN